jgi:hypothetical protein
MTLTFTLTAALAVLSLPWWPMLPPIWVCIMTVIVFVVGWKRRWWLACWKRVRAHLGCIVRKLVSSRRDPRHFTPRGYYNQWDSGHPFQRKNGGASDYF